MASVVRSLLAGAGLLACTVALSTGVASEASEDANGRLGLRYQSIEEGLLVTAVTPGMGAEDAGILPGSLIISVGDVDMTGTPERPRAALLGPPSSTASLQVVPPLAEEAIRVEVERRVPSARSARRLPHRPSSVRAYRKAVRDHSRRKALAAAQAMVDEEFGGLPPREAVGGSLASLMRRGDRFARDVSRVLATGAQDDPALLQGLARVFVETGTPEEAVPLLKRRAELVEPELELKEGDAVDVGGSFQARALLIDALRKTGDSAAATGLAKELLSSHRDEGVASLVGISPAPTQAEWRAELPPLAGFELPLLDGSTWKSTDHAGKVVVVNFWATWCGPCKQELPELAELYERRKGEALEVVAVSVDTGPRKKVAEMSEQLKLPFSVGIDPELAAPFQVSAFPAIRVIGADGALHYSARGYSPAAMETLNQAIDQAMVGAKGGGAPVASTWGAAAAGASLTRFFPIAGAAGVDVSEDGIVVGVLGASPVRIDPGSSAPAEASVASSRGMPGQRVAWLDGAVAADPGKLLVRKWDEDGEQQWLHRLPEPVSDLVVHNDAIWVAARDHLYVFGSDGSKIDTVDVALTDLAASGDRIVGAGPAVGFIGRVSDLLAPVADEPDSGAASDAEGPVVDVNGAAAAETPAPLPREVEWAVTEHSDDRFITSAHGDRAGGVVQQVVRGRFGPDGAERVAVVRADDRLLVFDDAGRVALVVELRRAGDLVAVDFDGDGQDSLIVGVPDHGVAWIDLTVP